MTGQITINIRTLGQKEPITPDWFIPYPPESPPEGEHLTLRELITRIVLKEVAAFRARKQERRSLRILSERQIDTGLSAGRVAQPERTQGEDIQDEVAVDDAVEAFEDGLYLVLVDGEEKRDLDEQVFLKPDSKISFIRLAMLSGKPFLF